MAWCGLPRCWGKGVAESCKGGKAEGVSVRAGHRRVMQPVVERNGETQALFPALLWVFLATLGELLLPRQPRVYKDALKSTDKALQMFSSLAG